jgi:hypothetical protein
MRSLTPHEKRTVRLGAIAIAVYLLAYGGWQVRSFFEKQHSEYVKLVREAEGLRNEIRVYQDKAQAAQKLMDAFHLDPANLSRTTAVAEASSALQKAAAGSGIAVGPLRESPARGSSRELASVQFEGSGPVPAVTGFFHRLETLGYPVLIETSQITADTAKPGNVKLALTLVILDFEQWKKEGAPHA